MYTSADGVVVCFWIGLGKWMQLFLGLVFLGWGGGRENLFAACFFFFSLKADDQSDVCHKTHRPINIPHLQLLFCWGLQRVAVWWKLATFKHICLQLSSCCVHWQLHVQAAKGRSESTLKMFKRTLVYIYIKADNFAEGGEAYASLTDLEGFWHTILSWCIQPVKDIRVCMWY